ncbi:MAG: hypothetical protein IJM90_07075 [Firmicutes bacterium]|nr:hypothetical protein [Bacillota bacterium]
MNDFLNKLQAKYEQLMEGRYGQIDPLNTALLVFSCLLLLLNLFVHSWILRILIVLALAYAVFRMVSKNITARSRENAFFEKYTDGLLKGLRKLWRHLFGAGGYRYYSCPKCHKELRVPRGHGRVQISCPHCSHSFVKNT